MNTITSMLTSTGIKALFPGLSEPKPLPGGVFTKGDFFDILRRAWEGSQTPQNPDHIRKAREICEQRFREAHNRGQEELAHYQLKTYFRLGLLKFRTTVFRRDIPCLITHERLSKRITAKTYR